jgi:hypothetical protein
MKLLFVCLILGSFPNSESNTFATIMGLPDNPLISRFLDNKALTQLSEVSKSIRTDALIAKYHNKPLKLKKEYSWKYLKDGSYRATVDRRLKEMKVSKLHLKFDINRDEDVDVILNEEKITSYTGITPTLSPEMWGNVDKINAIVKKVQEGGKEVTSLEFLVGNSNDVISAYRQLDNLGVPSVIFVGEITEVSLEGTYDISDLTPLRGLGKLEKLNLRRTLVEDLSPLSGLVALKELNLESTGVTELSPLRGLGKLEKINLRRTQVEDLSPLRGLVALKHLDLENTQIADLTPLTGLLNLKYLDLSCTQVISLTPLSGLCKLWFLDLSSTQVTNLRPLSSLVKLKWLVFYNTPVSHFTAASTFFEWWLLKLKATLRKLLIP